MNPNMTFIFMNTNIDDLKSNHILVLLTMNFIVIERKKTELTSKYIRVYSGTEWMAWLIWK